MGKDKLHAWHGHSRVPNALQLRFLRKELAAYLLFHYVAQRVLLFNRPVGVAAGPGDAQVRGKLLKPICLPIVYGSKGGGDVLP